MLTDTEYVSDFLHCTVAGGVDLGRWFALVGLCCTEGMAAHAVLLALPVKIAPAVMSAKTLREVEEAARDEVYLAQDQLAAKGG